MVGRDKKLAKKDLDIDTLKFTHGLYPALEGIFHCPAPSCGCWSLPIPDLEESSICSEFIELTQIIFAFLC